IMSLRLVIRTQTVLVACLLALTALAPAAQAGVGTITEFRIRTHSSLPQGIAPGPDGSLWFAEAYGNKIGRSSPAATFTAFPGPGPVSPLWLTEHHELTVGRLTPSEAMTEFPVPTATSVPIGIAPGPDGNLWFTEFYGNNIGRITPSGTITEFTVPTSSSGPYGIAPGPDGNLWFTEYYYSSNKTGRIT